MHQRPASSSQYCGRGRRLTVSALQLWTLEVQLIPKVRGFSGRVSPPVLAGPSCDLCFHGQQDFGDATCMCLRCVCCSQLYDAQG